MITEDEIKDMVNKHWLDRGSGIDDIMSMIALIQLNTNNKLDTLTNNLTALLDIDPLTNPNINPTLDFQESLKGLSGYALSAAIKGDFVNVIVGNKAITGVAKNNIIQYEKIIVTGGSDGQPDIVAIPLVMKTVINNEFEQSNILLNKDILNVNSEVAIVADGSSKSFNIIEFSNTAKILQITITQLTAGAANYTFEIWEKNSNGYNTTDRATLYLRTYSRDFTVSEDSDIIEPSLLYIDRDNTKELHCRLINNAGGTSSDFSVNVKAEGNPF